MTCSTDPIAVFKTMKIDGLILKKGIATPISTHCVALLKSTCCVGLSFPNLEFSHLNTSSVTSRRCFRFQTFEEAVKDSCHMYLGLFEFVTRCVLVNFHDGCWVDGGKGCELFMLVIRIFIVHIISI